MGEGDPTSSLGRERTFTCSPRRRGDPPPKGPSEFAGACSLILSRWETLFAWLPIETLLARDQGSYYQALQDSREPEIDAAPFISYMPNVIEASLVEYRSNRGRSCSFMQLA